MTSPVQLTVEQEKQVEELLARVRTYHKENYQPVGGWPKESLSVDVRAILDRVNSLEDPIVPTAETLEGLSDYVDGKLSGYAAESHTHTSDDITDATSEATPESLVRRDANGNALFSFPSDLSHASTKGYVDSKLKGKASATHSHELGEVSGLRQLLDARALRTHKHSVDDIQGLDVYLQSQGFLESPDLSSKADLVEGKLPIGQLPDIPTSSVQGLQSELDRRPTLLEGVLSGTVIPELPASKVTGLQEYLTTNKSPVNTVNGKIPESLLPDSRRRVVKVTSLADLTKLTSSDVRVGDVALVIEGEGLGTYQLSLGDPGSMSSWVKYLSQGGVTSVNGKSGAVELTARDVGARASGAVPMSEVTGLQGALEGKADRSAVEGLPEAREFADLKSAVENAQHNYPRADYVATTRIVSLSGQQSVDGELTPVGSKVLLTAQSSSSQNGIWVVSTSSWYRDTSMSSGSVPKGAYVAISKGEIYGNTLWQKKGSTPSLVGSEAMNWEMVLGGGSKSDPGVAISVGDGLSRTGDLISVKAGQGIKVDSSGVSLDSSGIMRKYAAYVPAGSSVATLTHNLGTKDVFVSVVEQSTGDVVLVGVTANTPQTVVLEFARAPQTNQYRAVVFG